MGKRKKNKSVRQHVKRKKKQPVVAASGAAEPVAKSKGQNSKEKVKAEPKPHKPTPCRVEPKTRGAIVKDEHGRDARGGKVIDVEAAPQMKCTPPLPWVEGGEIVDNKGRQKQIRAVTVENSMELHPMLNRPGPGNDGKPVLDFNVIQREMESVSVNLDNQVMVPFNKDQDCIKKRHGTSFLRLCRKYCAKDRQGHLSCVNVVQTLWSPEYDVWFSKIPAVIRGGLLGTVVPVRLSLDLTAHTLTVLENELSKDDCRWNGMSVSIDAKVLSSKKQTKRKSNRAPTVAERLGLPGGAGKRSILFMVDVGKVLSEDELRRNVLMAGDVPNSFLTMCMVTAKYKTCDWYSGLMGRASRTRVLARGAITIEDLEGMAGDQHASDEDSSHSSESASLASVDDEFECDDELEDKEEEEEKKKTDEKKESNDPLEFIDRRVAKVFNVGKPEKPEIFLGTMTDYTDADGSKNGKPFWRASFDDGDREDWHREELDASIALYQEEGCRLEPDYVPPILCVVCKQETSKCTCPKCSGNPDVPMWFLNEFLGDLFYLVKHFPPVDDDGRYDGERACWSKWCVPAIRHDCDYSDEMKAFRKEVRDAIIRKRRVKKEDMPAFMERLEILHYNFVMLPSQNMDDDLCRRACYRLLREGLFDVEAIVSLLSKHSHEEVGKHLANVYAQEVPGMGTLRGYNLLDLCIILRSIYNDECPLSVRKLMAFSQVGDKKARVALNGCGVIKKYGKDAHVLRMEDRWGINESDVDEEHHGDFNDYIGEVCQHLNRGLTSDLRWKSKWAEGTFAELLKINDKYNILIRGFEEGYPAKKKGSTKAALMSKKSEDAVSEAAGSGGRGRRAKRAARNK